MSISKEDVKFIAKLAKLEFTDNEIDDFTDKLSQVIQYVDKLKEANTANVKPTYHVNNIYNVMREDKVEESLSRDKVFSNAPDEENGYFRIPRILK